MQVKVHFVDYGNSDEVKWAEMADVPPMIQKKGPLAKLFTLHGVSFEHSSQSALYTQVGRLSHEIKRRFNNVINFR